MARHLRTLVALALCVIAAFVVVTLRARGWPVVPDLVLLPVLALALTRGSIAGAALGLAAGWVVDLVPPGNTPLGLTAIIYATAGAVAGRGTRVGPLPTRWIAVVCLGVAVIPTAARLLQGAWLGQPLDVSRALTELAITTFAAILVVPPLVRLDETEGADRW